MSAFSDSMAAVALQLITEFGESCSFSRPVLGEYNPNSASKPGGTPVTYTGVCFAEQYSTFEIGTSSYIERDDIKLSVAPITGNEPQINDSVTFSSNTYRIINVDKTTTNGATVLYILQVRE